MKKIGIIAAVLLIIQLSFTDVYAQRVTRKRPSSRETTERRSSRDKEPKPTFKDQLNYEIKLGNLGFGNGFLLDLKPNVGYKFHKYGTAGIGLRSRYSFYTFQNAKDQGYYSFGGFGHVKARLGESFYLQGEFHALRYNDITGFEEIKEVLVYPTVGAGYLSGGDQWKYGIEAVFIANEAARSNFGTALEWWINFSYNF